MFKCSALSAAILIFSCISIYSCRNLSKPENYRPAAAVTTETIADAVSNIGRDFVTVSSTSGKKYNPHAHGAGEYDIIRSADSNIIFYNGLYLEGRLQDLFKKINGKIPTVTVADGVPKDKLIPDESQRSGYNPHFWMDAEIWSGAVSYIADNLVAMSPVNERVYRRNEELYIIKLNELDEYIKKQAGKISEKNRILVTVHNAFDYFGRAYGFRTASLQEGNADREISSADISRLSNYIVENGVKVIFTEISASQKNMRTLQAALKASGYDVKIGGTLYADVLGAASTETEGYIGMMKHNIDTIVKALADSADGDNK